MLGQFGVPNIFAGWTQSGKNGQYIVTNGWGLPGGVVTTRFSPGGLSVTNVTTWAHAFVGTINRRISVSDGATFIDTHGYGNAGSGLLGALRDANNQRYGPGIFDALDDNAADYAKSHFVGC